MTWNSREISMSCPCARSLVDLRYCMRWIDHAYFSPWTENKPWIWNKPPLWIRAYRAILITKNCDMKIHDVSHCVSSSHRKLAMLAPTKKLWSFWKNCACPVYSFNIQSYWRSADADIYSIVRTAILCIWNSDTAARTFNCHALKEERMRQSRE